MCAFSLRVYANPKNVITIKIYEDASLIHMVGELKANLRKTSIVIEIAIKNTNNAAISPAVKESLSTIRLNNFPNEKVNLLAILIVVTYP